MFITLEPHGIHIFLSNFAYICMSTFPNHCHAKLSFLMDESLLSTGLACCGQLAKILIWVRCTTNRSHSTPCKKAEFEHLQTFSGHCLTFFLPVSGKTCHSPIKKVKRQSTLIISFSQHSPFFEGQSKKFRLKSDRRHTLPGECVGESATK